LDGRIYEDYKVDSAGGDKVTVIHKKGVSTIPYAQLDKDSRDKFILMEDPAPAKIPNGGYSYNGRAITGSQFDRLHAKFAKSVFTYDGDYYYLADNDGQLREYSGSAGFLTGAITDADKKNSTATVQTSASYRVRDYAASPVNASMQAIQKGSFEAYRAEQPVNYITKYRRTYAFVINLRESDYRENVSLPVAKLDKVKADYVCKLPNSMELLARLDPVTREQFADYLAKGGKFLVSDPGKKSTVVEQVVCPNCSGRGKISNDSYNKNRMGSSPMISCSNCSGTGLKTFDKVIPAEPKLIIYQP
jgi:hypothetical protein